MPARERASSVPSSQAALLNRRGDLQGTSQKFNVQLETPGPLALLHADPFARLGMEVERSTSRLRIADVDRDPMQRTPVSRWNMAEQRQAGKGEAAGEQRANMGLQPGDRIRAVNDASSATLMLGALEQAADSTNPGKVSLEVSRDLTSVLAPVPTIRVQRPTSCPGRHGEDLSPINSRLVQEGSEASTPSSLTPSPSKMVASSPDFYRPSVGPRTPHKAGGVVDRGLGRGRKVSLPAVRPRSPAGGWNRPPVVQQRLDLPGVAGASARSSPSSPSPSARHRSSSVPCFQGMEGTTRAASAGLLSQERDHRRGAVHC